MLIKGKKGSLQDIILMGGIILFFAIVILIAFKVTGAINTEIQGSDAIAQYDTNNYARDNTAELLGHFPGVLDKTFLFFAIGMALVTLVLAALVRVHPIFIPFYFIGLVIVIFFSGMFSNIYQEMAANPNLIAESSQLVFITYILEFLPFIVGIFGIILMIVMYKIWKADQFV